MGAAPSRETIRRGFFNVHQAGPSSTTGSGGGGGGGGGGKRQDIILIPLTREHFPSPDCPLFVQFHKARCDAAVNYYFRRPGNPGDLSCIPNYASSYRLPGEETRAQRRRRRQQERAARSAAAAASGGADERPEHDGVEGHSSSEDDDDDDADDEDEDDSYPSREALYRGVIDHVEEALFDTDAEMRQAYEWSLAHPHTTMGPDGKKQRKVLPVLCAVAFRSDLNKVNNLHGAAGSASVPSSAAGGAASGGGSSRLFASAGGAAPAAASPSTPSASAGGALLPMSPSLNGAGCSSASIAMSNMQAALENGVYMFGSIINIVGCFGFVPMQEEVEDAHRASTQANGPAKQSSNLLSPGSMQSPPSVAGGTYHHDPYSFTSSQASSGSMRGVATSSPMTCSGTLLSTRGAGGRHTKTGRHLAHIGSAEDVITLPPPVAAPVAAMVFLTKSAGEQNLGRVTYIAASTYYFQMIQAGLIERQPGMRMEGPVGYPSPTAAPAAGLTSPLPSYGAHGGSGAPPVYSVSPHASAGNTAGSPVSGVAPATPSAFPSTQFPATATAPPPPPPPTGPPRPFMPPMETFSFSSLLTNIPILSFLYEMKWRWGYLGVLRGGTPTGGTSRNSSFNAGTNNNAAAGGAPFPPLSSMMGGPGMTARGPGSMMGNHSTGGLSGIDRSVGQGVSDEMEMWITADQMLHGRISKDLAQRLCWSLAERSDVMQERVSQLPSEESGYWRYRGLVDQARPPPVPEPGRVVTIHPKDVYVMGSDVFPGFNEGDILRFDPERLVWFADHSIPLEGVVLAAMRPYCKQAREADSRDPAWVTRVCDSEEAEVLHGGDADSWYPAPHPSEAAAAALTSDPSLVHMHEHVGNFYVYCFERDGTTYYHGTVPNFANPNKKKLAGAAAAALPLSSGGGPNTLAAFLSSAQPSHMSTGAITPSAGAKAATNTSTTLTSTNKPAQSAATSNTNSSSASVPVPKSIVSALFSLLPASRTQAADKTSSGTSAGGAALAVGAAEGRSGGAAAASSLLPSTAPHGGASAAGPTAATTTYLATPVTSDAMKTARRWVQALYSYAYGAPNLHPPRRGPAPTVPPAGGGSGVSGGAAAGAAAGAGTGGAGPLGVSPTSRRAVPNGLALGSALGFSLTPGGSYPSTPRHGTRGCMTPTTAAATTNNGFPGSGGAVAMDVPVWPTPSQRLLPPTSGTPLQSPTASAIVYGTGGGGSLGIHTPGTSSLCGSAGVGAGVCNFVYHSRSSSRVQAGIAAGAGGGDGGAVDEGAASSYAARPTKRYTEGGSYEWDWRR